MPWNSVSPIGSISVRSNRPTMNENTTYIETTMGNTIAGSNTTTTTDHFWDVDPTLDGHHRFMKMPVFVSNTADVDPILSTGIDGVMYLRTVNATDARIQPFYRNSQGIYQFSPDYVVGTVVVPSGYVTVISVPANVYGDIFMFSGAAGDAKPSRYRTVTGFFRSDAVSCSSWALVNSANDDDTANGLKFGNGDDVSGLNIRARAEDASSDLTWTYLITYRGL